MRNPVFNLHMRKTKGADQLHCNHTADQRLCYPYIVQTFNLVNPKTKAFIHFCGCATWFVSDQAGNPKERFSLRHGSTDLLSMSSCEFPSFQEMVNISTKLTQLL